MVARMLDGTHRRILTRASVVQPPTAFEGLPANSQTFSIKDAVQVVKGKNSNVSAELWNPEFDRKLRNGIGKSVTEQNIAIEEILDAEPRLTRAAVVTRFVQNLLNHARNANLEVRESAIRQVLDVPAGSQSSDGRRTA